MSIPFNKSGSKPNCEESTRFELYFPNLIRLGSESEAGPIGDETLGVNIKRSIFFAPHSTPK